MNTIIRKFEDDLIALINGCEIPIEAKRLVLKDVLGMVEQKANETIANEIKELKDGTCIPEENE